MRTADVTRLFRSASLLAAAFAACAALAAKPEPPNGGTIDDGQNLTPLSRMSGNAVDKKLREGGKKTRNNKDCTDFVGRANHPKGKHNTDAEDCGVPGLEVTQHDPQDEKDGRGNTKRRTLKNTLTVHYEKPAQRGLSAWPDPRINPKRQAVGGGVENNTRDPDPLFDVVGVKFGPHPDPNRPPANENLDCANFHPEGGGITEEDGCNFKKLMVKLVNKKAAEDPPQGKTKSKSKAFHADADGNCLEGDPTDAAIKCGDERRVQHVTETYEMTCDKPGFILVDGHCRKDTPALAFAKALHVEPSAGTVDGGSAMMGFTFAPPRVKWGLDYSEEVCIDLLFDEFCFTVFAVFVGYDIDIAAGLRLPVDFEVDGVPLPKAIAGRPVSVVPKLLPADFSAQDYKDFCNLHGMADGWIIADCDRFAFPEYFSTQLNQVFPAVEVDGKELVAQAKIKAGIFVEVLSITVVSIGVDAGNDFSTMCTIAKMSDVSNLKDLIGDFVSFGRETAEDYEASLNLLKRMKDKGFNCSSFKTPFGAEQELNNPLVWTKPTFPFLPEAGLHLPADCTNAQKFNFKYKGADKSIPLCTGLALKYGPASLGLGLDVKFTATSGEIRGKWSGGADARNCSGGACNSDNVDVTWYAPDNGPIVQPTIGPVMFDNFENVPTSGAIRIDDLTYCLNELQIGLSANLEFGGILAFLPNLASIPVYSVTLGAPGCGIPIPQHNATGPAVISVPVENYALRVSGVPVTANPALLMEGGARLQVKPGEIGKYRVDVQNMGTTTGDFDFIRRTLPDQVDTTLPAGWTTTPTAAELAATVLANVPNGTTRSFDFEVMPFRHPRTRVGPYSIPVNADSVQAKALRMAETDPLSLKRQNAVGTLLVYVKGFREPKISILPAATTAKPGAAARTYDVIVQNFGNEDDVMAMTKVLVDSNTASCSLRTLGTSTSGCPYRAFPTVVANTWTNIGGLSGRLPAAAGAVLTPEQVTNTSFTLGVPADWAGMRDTTYLVTITATSTTDPENPAAFKKATTAHTVVATKQSMTRYIGLQLAELVLQIQAANDGGLKTGGAMPIVTQDVQAQNERALESILAGNLGGASSKISAAIRGMEAFLKAIQKVSQPYLEDWTLRANAIIQDMKDAEASNVAS